MNTTEKRQFEEEEKILYLFKTFFELLILNINLTFEKTRLEQASHWEVTKHHLQSAKHNISSESLTPSGHHLDGGEGVDEDGDNGDEGKDGDDGDEDGGDVQIKLTRIMLSWKLTLLYFQQPAPQVWT